MYFEYEKQVSPEVREFASRAHVEGGMRLPQLHRVPLLAFCSLALLVACGEDASPPVDEGTPPPVVAPPPAETPEAKPAPVEAVTPPGVWTKLDLKTQAHVNAVFAPREGLAFFGTPEGMFRFDGKAVSKVDLGCNCTVEDFDRDSGLALGTDGEKVYAGVFDGEQGYKPFAWQTDRGGPKPYRVSGNARGFIYVPADFGRTVRYHPTALFGGPTFGPEAQGGDLLLYGDNAIAVSGTPGYYWVGGGRGMYSHIDNYRKATEGDYTFVDVWNGWALRSDTWCNEGKCGGPTFLCQYEESTGKWVTDLEVPATGHGGAVRMIMQVKNNAITHQWILTRRLDGGGGTGADPSRYGAALGHVDARLQWTWVDFPKEKELVAAAFTTKEAFVTGKDGLVYRCVQPGCSEPSSAPK